MKTLFEIVNYKTDLKGFWKHEGKIYIDNIKPVQIENVFQLDFKLLEAFEKGEKAVFLTDESKAYIIYPEKAEVLSNKLEQVNKYLKASYIKTLLDIHGGLTVKRESGYFIITIWKD